MSSAKEFTAGKNQDLILALSGWLMQNSQDRAALAELGQLARQIFQEFPATGHASPLCLASSPSISSIVRPFVSMAKKL